MSQHDMNIENQGFPAFRSDLNNALAALASTSAGATAPSTTFAQQLWYDSTANLLKMRNTDNDAWITLAYFDQTNDEWEVRSAVIQAVDSAGVTIKNDGGTTLIEAKDDGTVVFRTDDVTIDTSGNLLVGTTTTDGGYDDADGGASVTFIGASVGGAASGSAFVSRRAAPLQLNRQGNDGDIAVFRKDGSTVGSIYNGGGNLGVNSSGGLLLIDDIITPTSGADATYDIGRSSARYKDLYLSGGVYLGGTGAANYLDDYEQGTFDPSLSGGISSGPSSYNLRDGRYVKVGELVTFQLRMDADGGVADGTILTIGGLPFTSAAPGATFAYGGANYSYQTGFNTNAGDVYHIPDGNSVIRVYQNSGFARAGNSSGINVNTEVILYGSYYTES